MNWLVANRLSGMVQQGLRVSHPLEHMSYELPLPFRAAGFVVQA